LQENGLPHTPGKIAYRKMRRPVSIILASASPRRKQLLAEAGFKFTPVPPDINESTLEGEGAHKCAERLALAKAKDVAGRFPDSLVIGADTVVDFQGQIVGKAADAKQAERITRKLFSAPHKVITAVAIVRAADGTEIIESETTTVYPKKLTDEQIAEHIKSESWRDKAGAYAIKEGGDEFIEKIEGSLTNVMGLPMELLKRMMRRFSR
jgi:septum formation protein